MANHQINITANGVKTLLTAGKYCDRNIDIQTNVESINQVPLATDKNGNIYNGTGYKNGYRIQGSSGNEIACDGSVITGFIPCPTGVAIVKNMEWGSNTTIGFYCSVTTYDENKNYLSSYISGADTTHSTGYGSTGEATVYSTSINGTLNLFFTNTPKYYRVSVKGIGSELVINHGVSVSKTIEENRITYIGTNTQTILGLDAYLILANEPKLAEIRNEPNLFIRVEFKVKQPQALTILKSWGANKINLIPFNTTVQYQFTIRFNESAEYGYGVCTAPINGTPAGVGCIHITESGELRVYSLSSLNYAIRPSDYKVIVEW